MTFREIANKLNGDLRDIFDAYEIAVNRIKKFKSISSQNIKEYLSPQQKEIYNLKKQGLKNKEIANVLVIDSNIVKTQLYRIKCQKGKQKHPNKN